MGAPRVGESCENVSKLIASKRVELLHLTVSEQATVMTVPEPELEARSCVLHAEQAFDDGFVAGQS